MALAIGTVTDSSVTSGSSTLSYSHTVPSGTNRGLWVATQIWQNNTFLNAVTGIQFNSVAMSLAKEFQYQTGGGGRYGVSLWYLAAPTVTTANVVVTYAGSSNDAQAATALNFTGMHQVSPVDGTAQGSGNTATPSCTVTTSTADSWILDSVMIADFPSPVQTFRSRRNLGFQWSGSSTVNGLHTPGTQAMDWTVATAESINIAVGIKPAPTGTTFAVDAGSLALAGTDTTLRIGSTTYLRYRK